MDVMRHRTGRALLLTLLLLMSTLIIAFPNQEIPGVEEDIQISGENAGEAFSEVVLNEAQKATLARVSGRASTTNWVKAAGPDSGTSNGPGNLNAVHFEAMAMDHTATNILVGGTLRGDVRFDSIQPATQAGPRAFVAAMTTSGIWLWLSMTEVPLGSSGGAVLSDIAVSNTGDIFVAGSFWNEIEWGSNFELSDGSIDGFVAKMDSSGSWMWGTRMGGMSDGDTMNDVAVDSNGDAYVVGAFYDHAYFGNQSMNRLQAQDGFVTKVNKTTGNFTWVEVFGGNQNDNATSIAIDSSDNIFLTGYYQGNIVFGTNTLLNSGYPSAFVSQIDQNGGWIWSNEGKTNYGLFQPFDIEVAADGIYLCGAVGGSIELDGVTWWANATVANAFVAKLNFTGAWLWALNSTGHTQVALDIALNPLGGVTVVGWFDMENLYIANATFGIHHLTAAPFAAFFAGVSPSGSWLWAEHGGGPDFDSGNAALFTGVGNLIMTGRFCVNHDGAGCSAEIGPANYSSAAHWHGSGFVWSLSTDSDLDTLSDINDNCPLTPNLGQADMDGDQIGDVCDPDVDGDGRLNPQDSCDGPQINWDSLDWSLDSDADGCRDSDEDDDDDADGVADLDDLCSNSTTHKNWTANDANDYDRDGCHDSIEDPDDDNDGLDDLVDECAFAPSERNWTSDSSTDYDSDGCKDGTEEDLDRDNDGVEDGSDLCMAGTLDWLSDSTTDHDGDGCRDSDEDLDDDNDGIDDGSDHCTPMATNWDSSGPQDLDKDGCRDIDEDDDDDGDGLLDDDDLCPRGAVGWISSEFTDNDGDGCRDSSEDLDDDNDAILDAEDDCPAGVTGWLSLPDVDGDRDGCRDADEDWDDDGDGLWEFDIEGNVIDQCPGTPLDEINQIDTYGCSPSQADSDGDGIPDLNDACPDVAPPEGLDRDEDGCTDDFDRDGVLDDVDAFPNDSTQVSDADGDGFGDNPFGLNPDLCPDTPSEWIENAMSRLGCAWEEEDADHDGILNGFEDENCSETPLAEISDIDENGCGISERDSDGDGVMDSEDLCPDTLEGAKMAEKGCSEAQISYEGSSEGGLNTALLAVMAILFLVVVGGGAAFFLLGRGDSEIQEDNLLPEASEVLASLIQQTAETSATAGASDAAMDSGESAAGGITVDEDGTEWWQDENDVWWYRNVSMDDWVLFE